MAGKNLQVSTRWNKVTHSLAHCSNSKPRRSQLARTRKPQPSRPGPYVYSLAPLAVVVPPGFQSQYNMFWRPGLIFHPL
ncbi:hypothetical protein SCLCIDRAFT_378269 [Scleroderma citrinum Foug A]|uniref:Uncharacterized protein n=1 Tax=Scleroderma citrinum Foug A TaxID=1036808 RepID=A0A0C3D0P5_9AGAM|nr:hypothetical protein SCLCIDRAFT_378269 [Scleroderma citrinum Foug A]